MKLKVVRLEDGLHLTIYWIWRKESGLIYGLTFIDNTWKFIPMDGLVPEECYYEMQDNSIPGILNMNYRDRMSDDEYDNDDYDYDDDDYNWN